MDFVDVLRERREKLREWLEHDPTYREFELIERLIEAHEAKEKIAALSATVPSTSVNPPVAGRSTVVAKTRPVPFATTATGMRAVLNASEEYLRRKNARAGSNEIHKELVRLGILKEGPGERSKVTSYLGRDKRRFDNVRGEGYGLR